MSQFLENVWIGIQVAARLGLWLLIAVVVALIAAALITDWEKRH